MIAYLIDAAVCVGAVVFLVTLIGMCRGGGSNSAAKQIERIEAARFVRYEETLTELGDQAERTIRAIAEQRRREQ